MPVPRCNWPATGQPSRCHRSDGGVAGIRDGEIPDAGLRNGTGGGNRGETLVISGLPGTGIHPESATVGCPGRSRAGVDRPQRIDGHGR